MDKLFLIALLCIAYSTYGVLASRASIETPITEALATTTDPFASVSLQGYAAFVWDTKEQKVLYQKNADLPLPLASLTKLMTSLVALRTMNEHTIITITQDHIKEEGDSGLLVNEKWSLKKLIEFVLVSSSNDGARALAPNADFVQTMNTTAQELGFTSMTFSNPTGLDISPVQPGGSGSARDAARLFEYILMHYPSLLDYTNAPQLSVSSTQFNHTIKNTNRVAYQIPGLIASKTGYSDLAGGNLAIVVDMDLQRPVVIVVLHSTPDGRFSDILTLSEAARQAYNQTHSTPSP